MDEIATKAIVIGVAIFVTLTIVTVVILEYAEISKIYRQVGETNVSFESKLDELDKFRNENKFKGIDVQNTAKKYNAEDGISVCVKNLAGEITCDDSVNIPEEDYNKPYISSFIEEGNIFTIMFTQE